MASASCQLSWNINPDAASCQPKILSYNRKDHFEYAGAAGGFIDKYGYPFCRGRILNIIEKDEGQYDDQADLFWSQWRMHDSQGRSMEKMRRI